MSFKKVERHKVDAGRIERATLTDNELLHADLRIQNPHELSSLSRDQPDPDGTFHLAGECHLAKGELGIRCSYCPSHTNHWNGFVLTSEGKNFLLGSTCGPKHFGLSFAASKRQLGEQKERQSLLRRLRVIFERSTDLIAACDAALFSEDLRRLEAGRAELQKVAPNLFEALKASVNAGFALEEVVEVRDLHAESRRSGNADGPVFRRERRSLGLVDGRALVATPDQRTRIYQLKGALSSLSAFFDEATDNKSTSALRAQLKRVEDSHSDAQAAFDECNRAHNFFSSRNRERLVRWSADRQVDRFVERGERLEAVYKDSRRTIAALEPLHLLPLPPLSL